MDVIKTYIPKRYRSKKLVNSGGSSGSTTVINSGGSELSPSAFVDSDTFYSMFEYDAINDAIKAKKEFYSVAGITAYGTGTVGGGGGTGVTVYNGLDSTDISLALSAAMGKQLNDTKLNSSAISAWALASVKPVYAISEITGLSTAIAGKADTTHQHTISQITDFAHVHQWSAIENKPNTFAPSAHSHLWADLTDKPATFTPSTHSHTKSQISDFAHTHLWADLTDKPTTFTPSAHNHTVSQISDFPASMPASDVYSWAKSANKPTYAFSEIGSQPTTLSGYGITDAAALTAFNNHVSDGVKHLTATERTNWNTAYTNYHTHSNKAYLDVINQSMGTSSSPTFVDTLLTGITASNKSVNTFINKFNAMFDTDTNGNIIAKTNLYSVGGLSAYQSGAGISGLTLQGDMNANGKNIIGAQNIYAGNAALGNVGINPALQWNYEGDENTMAEYRILTGEYYYAGNQVKYGGGILAVTGKVDATEFKFGRYKFMEDTNGDLGIYNGTTKIATILKTRTNSNL